jgi:hypothetical protein
VEDSDDISQDGDDSGERETVVTGIEEGETRPSNLRVSQSAYLFMTNISAHFRTEIEREYLETRFIRSEG